MDEFKTELKFIDVLKDKDHNLYQRFDYIKQKGMREWIPMLEFDKGSHAGYPHLLNIERNINKLVPDHLKNKFTAGEIFLLLTIGYMHDIGRIIEDPDKKDHPKKSQEIITENWAELGLPDERFAHFCGLVAFYHGVKNPFDKKYDIRDYHMVSLEPYGMLKIPFLSAILRIADEAENYWTRSLQKYLHSRIKEKGVPLFKDFRRFIQDVEFCLKGECIILHLPDLIFYQTKEQSNKINKECTEEEMNQSESRSFIDQKSLNNVREELKNVLEQWSPILSDQGICLNEVFFLYRNRLLDNLKFKNGELKPQKLQELFKDSTKIKEKCSITGKLSIQKLLDAMVELSLGTMGHDIFNLHILEAKVGQVFTYKEKWMVERMNFVTPELYITFLPEDKVQIQVKRENLQKIYNKFGCKI
jgi:hypothetical protein